MSDEPRMSMAEFQRDEEAQFKECELCGTRVHIDLEYLEEKGCTYCYKEPPTLLADIRDALHPYESGDWPTEGRIEKTQVELLIRAHLRITNLQAALANVVDVFDNGITVDAWDEYEKKLREVLNDKG